MADKYDEQKKLNEDVKKLNKEYLKEIEKNYNIDLPEISPKYDTNGNLKNKKEVLKKVIIIKGIIEILWNKNYGLLKKHKKIIGDISYNAFNITSNKVGKEFITKKIWDKTFNKNVSNRNINFTAIKKGKIKTQSKAIEKLVLKEIENNKNKKVINKKVKKMVTTNLLNQGKNFSLNEMNTYFGKSQELGTDVVPMQKKWVYTNRAKVPRDWHIAMNGQVADKDGYFTSPKGNKTKAPRCFGVANEDVACHCEIELSINEEKNPINVKEIKVYNTSYEKNVLKKLGIENKQELDLISPSEADRLELLNKYKLKDNVKNNKIINDYVSIKNYRILQREKGVQYWRKVDTENWYHSSSDVNELKRIGLINNSKITEMKKNGFA